MNKGTFYHIKYDKLFENMIICNMIKILKIRKYDKVQYDEDFSKYEKNSK